MTDPVAELMEAVSQVLAYEHWATSCVDKLSRMPGEAELAAAAIRRRRMRTLGVAYEQLLHPKGGTNA